MDDLLGYKEPDEYGENEICIQLKSIPSDGMPDKYVEGKLDKIHKQEYHGAGPNQLQFG